MATHLHAEHVGSLLRPEFLLMARDQRRRGEITDEQLRQAEDEAATQAIALQREAGIQVFTDGEARRGSWMAGLLESVGGTTPVVDRANPVTWYRGPISS
jgi:5-methyltetrahydropteroyltriglutamate--homocysteine methyltransferase